MQTVTEDGLRPSAEADSRCTILPIYNTNDELVRGIRALWSNKSPEDAFRTLAKPDVTVTNQADKDNQLPKIWQMDEMVKKAYKDECTKYRLRFVEPPETPN